MFVNTLDPVLVSIGPVDIHWYGLVYVLGFFAAYIAYTKTGELTRNEADSFIVWLIVGMLLGSRTFHFLFYAPGPDSILEFFAVWQGGMSFHGALAGLGVAGWWWAKRNGKDFWRLADIGAIVAAFFLALGRIANFINSEIIGPVTDVAWCVEFPNAPAPHDEGCRHPVQLYAMVKDLVIGGILLFLRDEKRTPGFIFWSFVMLYGVLRFIVQFWRTDAAVMGVLQWGHILSLGLVILAGIVLMRWYRTDLAKVIKP